MKKRVILFAFTAVLLMAALTLPLQKEKEKINPPSGTPTVISTEEEDTSLKPAWYQYYEIRKFSEPLPKEKVEKVYFHIDTQNSPADFFKVNLVNTSAQPLSIKTQNGSLIMIQEAKNLKGEWKPIEYWLYDWGDGSFFNKQNLEAGNSITFYAPRYKGKFETDIRFKLKISDQKVIYSLPFKGTISPAQFELKEIIRNKKESVSFL